MKAPQRFALPPGTSLARQIGVYWHAGFIAEQIWNWNAGPVRPATLRNAAVYYGNFGCVPAAAQSMILALIASYVPGGLDADLHRISEADRRAMMARCMAFSKAKLKLARDRGKNDGATQ